MADGPGTSIGAITLDLRILNSIEKQIDNIAVQAQQSAARQFEAVGDTASKAMQKPLKDAGTSMEKAITEPVENAQKTVQNTLKKTQDQVDDTISKVSADLAAQQSAANDVLTEKVKQPTTQKYNGPGKPLVDPNQYMANLDKERGPPAPDLSDTFKPAADAATLLQQKLGNVQMQLEAERQKLAALNAEFARVAVGSKAWDELSTKITAAEGRLISLQSTLNATQAKIDAPAQKAAAAAEKAAAAQEKAAQRAAAATEKAADREQAAQARVAVAAEAVSKRSGASMGSLRTQANAALSAATSTAKGMSRLGVMGRSFSAGLTGSLAIAGPLAAATAGFLTLRKAINLASINSDQFKKSLNEVKANLQVAFTPIYQAILPALNSLMAWLAAATKQVAAFVSALFGKTYAQSVAATKKMQDQAAAASKAAGGSGSKNQGQLASFDELNVIGQKDTSSTGGVDYDALNTKGTEAATSLANKFKAAWAGIAAGFNDYVVKPIQDNLSKFDAPVARFKALFANIGAQCAAWMQPLSNWFQNDFKSALDQGIGDATTILAGLMDSLAMVAETVWKAVQPAIDWMVKDGLPLLTDIFKQVSSTVVVAFDAVKVVFDTLWQGVIDPFAQLVSKVVVDLLNTFKTLWDQYGATTFDNIRTAINTTRDIFLNVWNSFLKPIFDQLFATLTQLWTDHLQPLVAQIGEFVAKLVNGALEIYNGFIAPIVNWFIALWGPQIAGAVNNVIKVIGAVVGNIADAATNIFKALGGVIDFLVGVFTGDWSKAWTGIKEIFSGVFGALYDIAKVPLNAIIGLVNGVISGINLLIKGLDKIHFDIPDWVPGPLKGKSFGISIPSIPSIPYLANGGVLTQPTLAMMGEYPGAQTNPEVAAPQSVMLDTFMQAIVPMLNELEEFRADIVDLLREIIAKNPNITLDGVTLARLLKPYSDEENKRVGGKLFDL